MEQSTQNDGDRTDDVDAVTGGDRTHDVGAFAVFLVFVIILYIVSLGPAALLHGRMPKPMQAAVEALYLPLEWLDDRLLGRPFSRYVDLWLGLSVFIRPLPSRRSSQNFVGDAGDVV